MGMKWAMENTKLFNCNREDNRWLETNANDSLWIDPKLASGEMGADAVKMYSVTVPGVLESKLHVFSGRDVQNKYRNHKWMYSYLRCGEMNQHNKDIIPCVEEYGPGGLRTAGLGSV